MDFGNGKVIHRTIYGNTATVISTANGDVLDVLPGLYDPAAYRKSLEQVVLLSQYSNAWTNLDRGKLRSYHRTLSQEISTRKYPSRFVPLPQYANASLRLENWRTRTSFPGIFSELCQENPSKFFKGSGIRLQPVKGNPPVVPSANTLIVENPDITSSKEVQNWKALQAETIYNEFVRRRRIHEYLADADVKHGTTFTKWIYKSALQADLDDPYLGLAPVLFAAYPFND